MVGGWIRTHASEGAVNSVTYSWLVQSGGQEHSMPGLSMGKKSLLSGGASELVSEGEIEVEAVKTANQLADMFTEPIHKPKMLEHCGQSGETKILRPRTLKSVHFCGRKKIKWKTLKMQISRKYSYYTNKVTHSHYTSCAWQSLFTWRTVDRIRSASHWSTGERAPFTTATAPRALSRRSMRGRPYRPDRVNRRFQYRKSRYKPTLYLGTPTRVPRDRLLNLEQDDHNTSIYSVYMEVKKIQLISATMIRYPPAISFKSESTNTTNACRSDQ
ncbi:unnamed protein product, partial [Nesidiocoris tenuis]